MPLTEKEPTDTPGPLERRLAKQFQEIADGVDADLLEQMGAVKEAIGILKACGHPHLEKGLNDAYSSLAAIRFMRAAETMKQLTLNNDKDYSSS